MITDQKLYLIRILTWFSAFVIVLFHYALWFEIEFYNKNKLLDYLVKRKEYGANFVYLYWAITGYILISSYYTNNKIIFKNYFFNIFSKYYPLHILTLFIVLLIQFINIIFYGETKFGYSNDFYHFFLHIFLASDWGFQNNQSYNAPIWFMSILIPIFFYFFLTFKILMRFKIYFSIFNMILFYYGFTIIFGYQNLAKFFNIQACFFYFYLGVTIYLFCNLINKYKKTFQILSLFGILISIISLNFSKNFLSNYLEFVPGTVLLFTSLIFLCQNFYFKKNQLSQKVNTFMNTSYSIYLWHFPLQLLFLLISESFYLNSDFFKNIFLFLLFIITLFLISLFSLKKFEKPFEKLIKKKFNINNN